MVAQLWREFKLCNMFFENHQVWALESKGTIIDLSKLQRDLEKS